MELIVGIIEATSDEQVEEFEVTGVLIGGDLGSGAFHFVVPQGGDYRGHLAPEFSQDTEMLLGKRYRARMREKSTLTYDQPEKVDRERVLLSLTEVPGNPPPETTTTSAG